ncbi:MAG TPA: hypothetical protein VJ805_10670 [Nitrospiraceae bacterium]|nr:hypothetical protein [Nitrospiraceae bacterium]
MKRSGIPVAVAFLLLGGCAAQEMEGYTKQYDQWLGTTKDARIKEMGIPAKCHTFSDGGEVCEWSVQTQDGRNETVGLTFDKQGKTCQWSYRGFYGQKKSNTTCA